MKLLVFFPSSFTVLFFLAPVLLRSGVTAGSLSRLSPFCLPSQWGTSPPVVVSPSGPSVPFTLLFLVPLLIFWLFFPCHAVRVDGWTRIFFSFFEVFIINCCKAPRATFFYSMKGAVQINVYLYFVKIHWRLWNSIQTVFRQVHLRVSHFLNRRVSIVWCFGSGKMVVVAKKCWLCDFTCSNLLRDKQRTLSLPILAIVRLKNKTI